MRYAAQLALALVLGLAVSAAARATFEVQILQPVAGRSIFGDVEVRVRVVTETPVAEVRVIVNGELETVLDAEPWATVVSLGPENRAHVLRVEALDIEGRRATAEVETPAIRIDEEVSVSLMQLFATVTRNGERVLDLPQQSFVVRDDGVRQGIVTFERGDVPLTAAVLIDASFSMRGDRLARALAGARDFVSRMSERDLLGTKIFSDQLLYVTPLSASPEQIAADPETLEAVSAAASGTTLNDHLYLALKELDDRAGRKVIILFSDGVDVESVLEIEDVRWKAERVQPIIYWIRADAERVDGLRYFTLWRDPDRHRANIDGLVDLVERSGGKVYEFDVVDEMSEIFTDILEELRGQYVIGYYPSIDRNDGRWHEVEIEVRGHRVRAVRGYYDE